MREISIKEKIFLYQITFCNQKAKIDLRHVYKRSMCLSRGEFRAVKWSDLNSAGT